MREEVSKQDATDVIQLLQESLLDVFTNDIGEIDLNRKGGKNLVRL
jgi:hypothetical protein